MILLALLLACTGQRTGSVPIRELSLTDPEAALAACETEPLPELRIGCLVDAAARSGGAGRLDLIDRACAQLPEGSWRDECHFRAGEEAGAHLRVELALSQCQLAERYRRFCITHMTWRMRPWEAGEEPPPDASGWAELARSTLSEDVRADAVDALRARYWFNRYVGTGSADPAAARAAPSAEAPHARGAWAIEWLRLAPAGTPLTAAHDAWEGRTAPLTGPVLLPARRVGRYDAGLPIPGETALPHVATFGDGRRIVGATEAEDIDVAVLEAWYFLGAREASPIAPWLDDPRRAVRYTAFRIYRTVPSNGVRERLERYREDPDPVVRLHVEDALTYETWKGKGQRPSGAGVPGKEVAPPPGVTEVPPPATPVTGPPPMLPPGDPDAPRSAPVGPPPPAGSGSVPPPPGTAAP